jgi:hypothetical protein
MADELEFDAAAFQNMSHRQKIRICRLLADRARMMGSSVSDELRPSYIRIAEEWDGLADEMEAHSPPGT